MRRTWSVRSFPAVVDNSAAESYDGFRAIIGIHNVVYTLYSLKNINFLVYKTQLKKTSRATHSKNFALDDRTTANCNS